MKNIEFLIEAVKKCTISMDYGLSSQTIYVLCGNHLNVIIPIEIYFTNFHIKNKCLIGG